MKRGFTILEVVVATVFTVVTLAWGFRSAAAVRDRALLAGAVREFASLYQNARMAAVLSGRRVRIEFAVDSAVAWMQLETGDSVIGTAGGRRWGGVRVAASQSQIGFSATGLGLGAANASIVFSRAGRLDTLVTSRLGRLRRRTDLLQPISQ